MKNKLVILTTHFGTNFSGGSTATCEIFSRLENQFEEIIVVGTQLGDHSFKSVRFIKYNSWIHAIRILKQSEHNTVFYGDFYNSFLFILAKVPFVFTYHDNWPELGYNGLKNRLKSFFYTNIYNIIFKSAKRTITVSKYKLDYIKRYTSRTALIYNGYHASKIKSTNATSQFVNKIIMVGNIDNRKYRMALKLFQRWTLDTKILVDIYGNISDPKLADKLSRFPFVSIKGFNKQIPYSSYCLLLHTSIMENLPIVFCEALQHKIPVVAFDVGGSNEIIDEKNGELIEPYNLKLMERQIKAILDGSKVKPIHTDKLKQHSWTMASSEYLRHLTN